MLFVLPDYRVRIHKIEASEQTLSVKLEKERSFTGARLHCLVDGPGGRDEMARDVDGEDIVLNLKAPVEKLEIIRVFITSAADGVVDWYEQIPTFHSGGSRWITGQGQPSEQDIVTEIRKGEGPHQEFKPFVKLGAGEKKAAELMSTMSLRLKALRTICAKRTRPEMSRQQLTNTRVRCRRS